MNFQQLKKGVFGKGSFRNLCAELCFSRKFLSDIAPPIQAFSGKRPREKPQNAAAEIFPILVC